jgi:pilus assembly protein CpaC
MLPLTRTFAATALVALAATTALTAHAQDRRKVTEWLDVPVGQSFIYQDTRPIARILVSDPEVAEIKLLEQGQFQVRGVGVGSTDLWVWFRDDINRPVNYQLTVHEDLSNLVRRVGDIAAGGTPPRVYPLNDRLVVEGKVPDLETLERVAQTASVYDPEFVNLMTVEGDHQVQLEVVFAEVNRSGLRELGFNALYGDNGSVGSAISSPASFTSGYAERPAIDAINGGYVIAPTTGTFNLIGTFADPMKLAAILSVMEQNNISKILARPTLVALSGQQAEFLAGGEIPIPIAQQGNQITLEFKEYGVKLVFVPTVLGADVVDMRVYVEYSEVDSATAIRLTGIEIPGFVTRKSSSHLRIESGMTFAMAGMLNETTRMTRSKVPILGDIPIVGALFRYVQHKRNETELMIFVTPRLVRPMAPGEVPPWPGTSVDNNPNDFELFLLGLDHRTGSTDQGGGSGGRQGADPGLAPAGEVGLAR